MTHFCVLLFLLISTTLGIKQEVGYNAALLIDAMKFCSATFVSDQYLVTSANCVHSAEEIDVTIGLKNLLQVAPAYFVLYQKDVIYHDNITHNSLKCNIALLKIPKSENLIIGVAKLSYDSVKNGDNLILSGYNLKDRKQRELGKQNVTVVNEYCQKYTACFHSPASFFSVVANSDNTSPDYRNVGSPVLTEKGVVGVTVHVTNEVAFVIKIQRFVNWIGAD